jgi:hypothetical protein
MYGITSASKRRAANALGVLMIAAALEGCNSDAASADRQDLAQSTPPAWYEGELPILRFKMDKARERGWVLTGTGVRLLDLKTRQTTGHVSLPDWIWADEAFSCPPDLALGPKGEVLISSNVVSTLWRIDPVSLAVSKHEPVLDADTDKDVGFTGLAYSAKQGVFFGVTDYGALWRIDAQLGRAQKITPSAPLSRPCVVASRNG